MGKQSKSNKQKVSKKGTRQPERELVKKPPGMCKVVFRSLARAFALEIRIRNREKRKNNGDTQ